MQRPPKIRGRPFDLWGWYELFGLGKNFFCPLTSGDRIFFLTYNGVIIFFRIIGCERSFFSEREFFFRPVFPFKNFFPRNQSAGYFSWNHRYPTSRVKWSAPPYKDFYGKNKTCHPNMKRRLLCKWLKRYKTEPNKAVLSRDNRIQLLVFGRKKVSKKLPKNYLSTIYLSEVSVSFDLPNHDFNFFPVVTTFSIQPI